LDCVTCSYETAIDHISLFDDDIKLVSVYFQDGIALLTLTF